MFSLNVPVPGTVARLASDLHPLLVECDSVRDRHTLVIKRFADDETRDLARLRERLRPVLAGTPAFEARITEIDAFDRPTRGTGPVVYFAVESPGLRRLHRTLTDAFGPIAGLEGDDYVPHVTLARGGSAAAVERLCEQDIDPVSWTASRLIVWDSRYREPVARFRLPR